MNNWLKEIAAEIPLEDLPEEYQIVAELFGVDGALRLAKESGGMRIYVPKFEKLIRARRDERIRAEFNGANHRELARKYELTETWVREIVARRPYAQTDIFSDDP
jgi:Mor family transcriptional regulator